MRKYCTIYLINAKFEQYSLYLTKIDSVSTKFSTLFVNIVIALSMYFGVLFSFYSKHTACSELSIIQNFWCNNKYGDL